MSIKRYKDSMIQLFDKFNLNQIKQQQVGIMQRQSNDNKVRILNRNKQQQKIIGQQKSRAMKNWGKVRNMFISKAKQIKKQKIKYMDDDQDNNNADKIDSNFSSSNFINNNNVYINNKANQVNNNIYIVKNNNRENKQIINNKRNNRVNNILSNNKNNMYNIFDSKQSKIVKQNIINHKNKNDIKSQQINKKEIKQQLIETIYKLKIYHHHHKNIQNNGDKSNQFTLINNNNYYEIQIISKTPIPSINKIIQSTTIINNNNSNINSINNKKQQIDTTGFWIWQGQEILSYFLLTNYYKGINIQQGINEDSNDYKGQQDINMIQDYNRVNNLSNKNVENRIGQIDSDRLWIDYNKINKVLQLGGGSSGLGSLSIMNIFYHLTNQSLQQQIINKQSKLCQFKQCQLSQQNNDKQNRNNKKQITISDGKQQNIRYLRNNINMNKIINENNYFLNNHHNQHNLMTNNHDQHNIIINHDKQNNYNSGQQINVKGNNNKQCFRQQCLISSNNNKIMCKAQYMLWGTQMNMKYDFIIASDCLFFQSYHQQLINTLQNTMHQQSIAIFVNPKRGKSMHNFIQLLLSTKLFNLSFIKFNNTKYLQQQQNVKNHQQFDPQKHIYYFLYVTKNNNKQTKINKQTNNNKQI